MTTETIVSGLKTVLENNATLAAYVEQVLLGRRVVDNITSFPTLWIEPDEDNESQNVYGKFENTFSISIVGLIRNTDADKQIVGDAVDIGVLKFANDVKKALDDSNLLTNTVVNIIIGKTTFSDDSFPVAAFSMGVDIVYVQNKSVRT